MCFYRYSVCLTKPNKILLIPWEEGMGSGKNLYTHSWVSEVHFSSLHSSLFLTWIPKGGYPLVSQGQLALWKCTSWTRFLLLPFWSHEKDEWAKKHKKKTITKKICDEKRPQTNRNKTKTEEARLPVEDRLVFQS